MVGSPFQSPKNTMFHNAHSNLSALFRGKKYQPAGNIFSGDSKRAARAASLIGRIPAFGQVCEGAQICNLHRSEILRAAGADVLTVPRARSGEIADSRSPRRRKHQTPKSKHQKNPKSQAPKGERSRLEAIPSFAKLLLRRAFGGQASEAGYGGRQVGGVGYETTGTLMVRR
jgi:hypothetical protein